MIINWSVGGVAGFAYVGIYAAAKHGIGMTKTAAIEAGPYNIRANGVPRRDPLEIMGAEAESAPTSWRSRCSSAPPNREVSEIAAFLCPTASWVTGAVIPCDGGVARAA